MSQDPMFAAAAAVLAAGQQYPSGMTDQYKNAYDDYFQQVVSEDPSDKAPVLPMFQTDLLKSKVKEKAEALAAKGAFSEDQPCCVVKAPKPHLNTVSSALVATRDVAAGEVLAVDESRIWVPAEQYWGHVCDHCMKMDVPMGLPEGIPDTVQITAPLSGHPLKTCSCGITSYCSEACRHSAHNFHHLECKALKSVFKSAESDETVKVELAALAVKAFIRLSTKENKLGKPWENCDIRIDHQPTVNAVAKALSIPVKEACQLMTGIVAYTFDVSVFQDCAIGVGFSTLAVLPASCDPSASVVTWKDGRFVIKAIAPVSKGSPFTISCDISGVVQTQKKRSSIVLAKRGNPCACVRCRSPRNSEEDTAMRQVRSMLKTVDNPGMIMAYFTEENRPEEISAEDFLSTRISFLRAMECLTKVAVLPSHPINVSLCFSLGLAHLSELKTNSKTPHVEVLTDALDAFEEAYKCSVVSRGPSHCDTTFLFSICKALEDSLESAADMEEETEGAEMEEIVEEAEEEGNDEMESEQEE